METKLVETKRFRIRVAPFLIALICFFLPFAEPSCNHDKENNITGIQWATGLAGIVDNNGRDAVIHKWNLANANLFILAALICTIAAIGLCFLNGRAGKSFPAIAGSVGFILIQFPIGNISVDPKYGFFLVCLLLWVGVLICNSQIWSFFKMTTWYAVLAPVAVAVFFGVGWLMWNSERESLQKLCFGLLLLIEFLLVTSIIASIVSLFGIRRHNWRVIVWKSVSGFVLSLLVWLSLGAYVSSKFSYRISSATPQARMARIELTKPNQNQPQADTPNIVFTESGSGSSIDTNKWATSGSVVVESDGKMQVLTTVTDGGGLLTSVPIQINHTGDITISRNVLVRYANANYVGDICMKFGPAPWASVFYANATYSDGKSYMARYGTYLGRNTDIPAGAHFNCIEMSQQTNMSAAFPGVWNTWFSEKIVYSPTTGYLQYFVNNQKFTNYFIGIMPPTNNPTLQLGFRAWGWNTGHQQIFSNLVVSQTVPTTFIRESRPF